MTMTGLFRQPAVGNDEAIALVASGEAKMFVGESEYRREGFAPPFDMLPSQDEYEAAVEAEDPTTAEDKSLETDLLGAPTPDSDDKRF